MTELWLVRHGQTDWNLQGRYQGQADQPLNATGLAQAQAIARQLSVGPSFQAIYSSDLRRAAHTAEVIAGALQLPVYMDARLREIDQGEWQGRLVSELATIYSTVWAGRDLDPVHSRPPGGESVAEVAARVRAAADDIARAFPSDRILVVSHGLALATLIARGRGLPLDQVYHLIPENTHSVVVAWPPNQAG